MIVFVMIFAVFGYGKVVKLAHLQNALQVLAIYLRKMIAYHTQRLIFITAHDGFVMQDLVSYNQKHNEAMVKKIVMVAMKITVITMG